MICSRCRRAVCVCVLQNKKEAWGIRCWKGKLDEAPTAVRQSTKREWGCLTTPTAALAAPPAGGSDT